MERKNFLGSLRCPSPWFKFLSCGLCETSLQAQNKFSWSLTVIPMGFECLQLPAQLHPEATEHIPVWQEPLALGTCDLCSDFSLDGSGVTQILPTPPRHSRGFCSLIPSPFQGEGHTIPLWTLCRKHWAPSSSYFLCTGIKDSASGCPCPVPLTPELCLSCEPQAAHQDFPAPQLECYAPCSAFPHPPLSRV